MTLPPTAATQSLRVAVIDTDSGFVQVLSKRLERLGWEYRVFPGAAPAETLIAMRLSVLVVDLAVFGPEAWDELDRLSSQMPGLPLIVCTGASTVAQRVRGLRMGADDWLTKPCHPEELIARIEAVTRRGRGRAGIALEPVVAGEIEIRPDRFQAYAGDHSLHLTRREYELLALLAAAEGRVLEREAIYQQVWGYRMVRGDRSVDVFVRKLRQKLERGSPGWRYVHTHFGVGYRFAALRAQDAEGSDAGAPTGPDPAREDGLLAG